MVEETPLSLAATNRECTLLTAVSLVALVVLPVHELPDPGAAEILGRPWGQLFFRFADSEPEPARVAGRDAPPWGHAFEQREPALVVAYFE
jgi:hypothetical protein